jgi:hypothetical protein
VDPLLWDRVVNLRAGDTVLLCTAVCVLPVDFDGVFAELREESREQQCTVPSIPTDGYRAANISLSLGVTIGPNCYYKIQW